ncbi:MAG TPA: hypothetical protein VFF65_02580, partial [Phycisphaerales bacterium]|nr:hypothetical protein [Phycisphaerales bacterium]
MATTPPTAWTARGRTARLAALGAALALSPAALGQWVVEPKTENPVFVDESPAAVEALARAAEHAAADNLDQAVRTLQRLLDERADEFVPTVGDVSLFESVRSRAHTQLLGNAKLLARYREASAAGARQLLEGGRLEDLVKSRLLTPEGLTAALRLSRKRVLDGQFDSAVMTLLDLTTHPDRSGDQSRAVAEAATLVARYDARPSTRSRLTALMGGAAMPAVEPPAESPATPSLGDGSPATLVEDLVNQPLGTGVFGDASLPIQPLAGASDDAAVAQLPPYARELRYWPAVGERSVYFSNGATVTALDRVSMRRLWSVNGADMLNLPTDEAEHVVGAARRPTQNTWEEVVQPVLSAGDSLLVSVVGRDHESLTNGEGVEHLVGIDAVSGTVRYAVPLRSLDPQLADCYARGPLVTDGRVVVVSLLKRQNQRRLMASVLVGVEATTGKRLWTRVVGSAGVLPFYRVATLMDATAAGDGVVYRTDRLGVVGAYTIAEGRSLWVRRLGSKVALDMQQAAFPWMVHRPLVTGAGLVTMSCDRDEVLVLDRDTGKVTARRRAEELGRPEYLVATGTHLVAVGEAALSTVRLDQVETGAIKASNRLGGAGGIRGRVTAAGPHVLVPSATGVALLDPAAPEQPLRTVKLDAPGSPLALPEGLLVVDDARAHMYCTWAVAATHLKSQVASSPGDAGPATELLLLAERAAHPEELLPAADSALAALEKQSTTTEAASLRAAEHRSSMVATLLRAANRSIGKSEQPGATLDTAGIDGAVERAARAARTPADRVAVLLTTGEVHESRAQWSEAATAYQRVLEDPILSAAGAPGTLGGTAASYTAVERLARVVRTGGRGSYAVFDERFSQELAALGPVDQVPVERLEGLAALYPVARRAPALWLGIASRYAATGTQQGQRAQARALERGVQAAERAGGADPAVTGELNGTLVKNLIDRSLLAAAADALARAEARFPGAVLTAAGVPLAVADLRAKIQRDLAGALRWPRVGVPRDGSAPQVIDGWVLMEPLIRATGGGVSGGSNPPFLVMHKGDDRRTQVALFGLKRGQLAGEAAEGATSPLTELWFSESGSDPWTLV